VRADPAADLTALLAPQYLSAFMAASMAFAEFTRSVRETRDRAEPAADFADLLEFGRLKASAAAKAALLRFISLSIGIGTFL
jgi:hypothetical protein